MKVFGICVMALAVCAEIYSNGVRYLGSGAGGVSSPLRLALLRAAARAAQICSAGWHSAAGSTLGRSKTGVFPYTLAVSKKLMPRSSAALFMAFGVPLGLCHPEGGRAHAHPGHADTGRTEDGVLHLSSSRRLG